MLILSLAHSGASKAQTLQFSERLKFEREEIEYELKRDLDSLYTQINRGAISGDLLCQENLRLHMSVLGSIASTQHEDPEKQDNSYPATVINLYPIDDSEYLVQIAFMSAETAGPEAIKLLFSLTAKRGDHGHFRFACPLRHRTRYWKQTEVGKITYHHSGPLNVKRAEIFDRKNREIAEKMSLEAEHFDFYMSLDYQQINRLLGYDFEQGSISKYRNGYGVDANHIFAIMNNEDFSHDVFHYYSGQIYERKNRNWITEEGIAYLWGNAYWTDPAGEMIEQNDLLADLDQLMKTNPDQTPTKIFEENTKAFSPLAPEVSARSTISALICQEVEQQHGIEGVLKMISCGRVPNNIDPYMATIKDLLGITEENFNQKVRELLDKQLALKRR